MKTLNNLINESAIETAKREDWNFKTDYKKFFTGIEDRLNEKVDELKEISYKKILKFYKENPTKRNGLNVARASVILNFIPLNSKMENLINTLREELALVGIRTFNSIPTELGSIKVTGTTTSKFNVMNRPKVEGDAPKDVEYKIQYPNDDYKLAIDYFDKLYKNDIDDLYAGNMRNLLPGNLNREYLIKFYDCINGAYVNVTRGMHNKFGSDIKIRISFRYDGKKAHALLDEIKASTKLQAYASKL